MPPNTPSPVFPLSPPEQSPPPNHRKKILIISLILAVVIILIGGIVYALTKTPLKNNVPFLAYSSMPDVTPKTELKVADNRYVGACRALPPEIVQDAVKPFEKASSYSEDFYAQSPTTEQSRGLTGAMTSCRYLYLDADGTSLALDLQQFPEAETAKQKWDTNRKLGNGEYRKELLEGKQGGDGSELDETFKSFINEQDIAALEARSGGVPLTGLDKNILYVAGDGSLVSYRQNVKIVLKYEFGGSKSTDGMTKLSKQEAEASIATIKPLFAAIYKNIDDSKLSQAPQRSIPNNQKEIYGARVIEPCGLLTAKLFSDTTEKEANGITTTESSTNDLTRTNTNRAGQILYPNTSCVRNYVGATHEGTIERDRGDMSVKVVYTPSATEAKAYVDREVDNLFKPDLDLTKSPKELGLELVLAKPTTAADHTYVFDTSRLRDIKPDTALIKKIFFSVDSYVVILDANLKGIDRTPQEYSPTDDAYEAAIKTITEKLRAIN